MLELGWVQRSPSVRRYMNGDIVVPKKPPRRERSNAEEAVGEIADTGHRSGT